MGVIKGLGIEEASLLMDKELKQIQEHAKESVEPLDLERKYKIYGSTDKRYKKKKKEEQR